MNSIVTLRLPRTLFCRLFSSAINQIQRATPQATIPFDEAKRPINTKKKRLARPARELRKITLRENLLQETGLDWAPVLTMKARVRAPGKKTRLELQDRGRCMGVLRDRFSTNKICIHLDPKDVSEQLRLGSLRGRVIRLLVEDIPLDHLSAQEQTKKLSEQSHSASPTSSSPKTISSALPTPAYFASSTLPLQQSSSCAVVSSSTSSPSSTACLSSSPSLSSSVATTSTSSSSSSSSSSNPSSSSSRSTFPSSSSPSLLLYPRNFAPQDPAITKDSPSAQTLAAIQREQDRQKTYKQSFLAICQEYYLSPVTLKPINATFCTFTPNHPVRVFIPLEFIHHDQASILRRGGLIDYAKREIECFWTGDHRIPRSFVVDVENIDFGDIVKVADLKFPRGLVPAKPANGVILRAIKTSQWMKKTEESTTPEPEPGKEKAGEKKDAAAAPGGAAPAPISGKDAKKEREAAKKKEIEEFKALLTAKKGKKA
eukprot:TRINITY_DN151_c0_g1_i1.p1 TRINITY_DN151_c0_g1~~TRINITY_DN151_c0_g1_i1.p1  ORF type:complete len:486 (+),score=148.20 TRINITY_DN151_c0_g1_i1:26-1483(+)